MLTTAQYWLSVIPMPYRGLVEFILVCWLLVIGTRIFFCAFGQEGLPQVSAFLSFFAWAGLIILLFAFGLKMLGGTI